MSHIHQDKKILNRVKRLKGQITSIEQSLESNENSCIEILQQVAAVKGALNGLMNELIEQHLRHHVLKDSSNLNEAELAEFMKLLKRYS